jgi:citrate synthase
MPRISSTRARLRRAHRLIARRRRIAAWAPPASAARVYPDNDLSFTGNFLNMLFKMTELNAQPNPVLARALDVLFILHADHEQNCSTTTIRTIAARTWIRSASRARAASTARCTTSPTSGAADAERDRVGGAVPQFIKRVKAGDGAVKLMGFGHRVTSPTTRAPGSRRSRTSSSASRARTRCSRSLELDGSRCRTIFITRKLYPNVDFYSGLIYQAMGFPVEMFPVLFAIPRTAGWIAQWEEMLLDPEQKIARPRQIYTGAVQRDYVPREKRA